jgi:hypothetical protein
MERHLGCGVFCRSSLFKLLLETWLNWTARKLWPFSPKPLVCAIVQLSRSPGHEGRSPEDGWEPGKNKI